MATTGKPKDTTSNLAKEKKVKAASNSQSAVHSNQAKRSLGSPSIKDQQRPSSSPSEKKAIPNYLKPTISSRHESFKHGKKPAQDDGVSKPVLNRRRSFDKPVSISRMEKSFDSPGPRERTTHVRPSSSSLTKSTVAVSGRQSLLDSRDSKSFKYGSKSHTVYVKRTLKKNGPGSSCSGDDYSTESELESKVERAAENEFSISPQITASEVVVERDVMVQESEEADDGDHGKIEASEIVAVSEKGNEDENSLEGGEENLLEDDGAKTLDKEDEHEEEEKEIAKVDDTGFECNPDENSAKKAETEDITEDKLREEVIHLDDKEDCTKQEKKASEEKEGVENEEDIGVVSKEGSDYPEEETVISKEGADNEENKTIIPKEGEETENAELELSNRHDQEQGRKEGEETESATEETKPQTKTVAVETPKRHGQGHGRKDTPAYNDVIEETASKLLEKRKNKVKALVGAFETVIDYESASK